MEIRPGEIFPDEVDATLLDASPYTPTASDMYLELVKGELTLDGHTLVGEPVFGGYHFNEGIWFIEIDFTDEAVGPMRKLYPAPADNEPIESQEN